VNSQPSSLAKQQTLSEVIELIYNLAEQPSLWPDLLSRMNSMMQTIADEEKLGNISITEETAKIHQMLLPHFERSIKLNQKIFQLEAESHAISAILDRLPLGVIVTNSDAVLVGMNAHAKALLALNESLKIEDGKLVAHATSDTVKLHRLLRAATTAPVSPQTHFNGESLLISANNDIPCSIHVAPSAHSNIHSEHNLAAVFISSASIQQDISIDSLQSIYSFTLAEAKLVQALLQGSNSLSDAAELLHVSKHTVRTQMKSILEKPIHTVKTKCLKAFCAAPQRC